MGKVLVLGATGFTGRLVAHELAGHGVAMVLGGRSRERLEQLAASLPGDNEVRTGTPSEPATLAPLFEGVSVVVNTVGPFTDLGEPVVEAAVDAGVHYLDTTGEQGFMLRVLERFDGRARDAAVAVVCAQAFEYALGCCACGVAVSELGGRADAVEVYYRVEGMKTSPGTRRSIMRALSQPMMSWVDGRPVTERPAQVVSEVVWPGESRPLQAISFPGGEPVQVPQRNPVGTVRSFMLLPPKEIRRVRMMRPLLGLMGAKPIQALADALAKKGSSGPDEASRAACRFGVLARARRGGETYGCFVEGGDPYGITAVIAALGARRLLEAAPLTTGVVSTAMAFDPAPFLDELEPAGVEWELHPPMVDEEPSQPPPVPA